MKIDFVICWVDGTDPQWHVQKNRYRNADDEDEECRYRDWDLLKYWFRAVEAFAPWVNRIHFVTCGQIPSWLNTNHPKLKIIHHEDYIPKEYLPTFSSHVIELNLHRIEGLSEHFVYFNDDMFLNRPVQPVDFFRNNLPRDTAVLNSFCPAGGIHAYIHAVCNVMSFLNKHFDKHAVMLKNLSGWFHPCYGKHILKNLYYWPSRSFSGLYNGHIPSSMCRSTFDDVWKLEPELLDRTCKNRFRNLQDVNQYIMSYYQICTGRFSPRSSQFGKCYSIGAETTELLKDITHGKHKTICVNDNSNVTHPEQEKAVIGAAFQKRYPNKSSFEL